MGFRFKNIYIISSQKKVTKPNILAFNHFCESSQNVLLNVNEKNKWSATFYITFTEITNRADGLTLLFDIFDTRANPHQDPPTPSTIRADQVR